MTATWLAVCGRELGDAPLLPHQALVPLVVASTLRLSQLQSVRLRFGGAAGQCERGVRLECVVERSAAASAAAIGSSRVVVHPWVLEYFQLLDGHPAVIEADSEVAGELRQAPGRVIVSVQAKYAASASSSSTVSHSKDSTHGNAKQSVRVISRPNLLPESVGKGNVSVERAIARQLKATHGSWSALQVGQLVPIRVLQELFVFRIEALRDQVDSGESPSIEVVGIGAASVDDDSHPKSSDLPGGSSFDELLTSRLKEEGFAGSDAVVKDVLMHLALVLNNDSKDATDYREIGSHGLILSGVYGVGKSLALKVIEKELAREGVTTWQTDGMSLIMDFENSKKASAHSYIAEKLELLRSSYAQKTEECGSSSARVVLIIDDIDTLFQSLDGQPADEDTQTQHLPPLGSALLRVLEDITTKQLSVAILGASTKAEVNIPASARRTGRFGKILELIVPTESMRRRILEVHLQHLQLQAARQSKNDPSSMYEVVQDFSTRLAALTGGYVAKDLVRICRNAAVAAFSRSNIAGGQEESRVVWADLLTAQQQIKPSQLRELNVESPGTTGEINFVGYHEVRHQLFEFVSWKFQPSAAVQRLGVGNTSGILLYGPSGCGKSLLVKELTARAKVNCVSVKSSELLSKYFGDSEKAIRELFARARGAAPCLLFFDEFDAVAHKRSFDSGGDDESAGGGVYARILSTFLNELDGVGISDGTSMDGILVIAATNRKEALDAALIRPGRIDKTLELGYPSDGDIQELLRHYTRKMPLAEDVDLAALATSTSSSIRPISGADIAAVCKEAAFRALREDLDANLVSMRHFEAAWSSRLEESPAS